MTPPGRRGITRGQDSRREGEVTAASRSGLPVRRLRPGAARARGMTWRQARPGRAAGTRGRLPRRNPRNKNGVTPAPCCPARAGSAAPPPRCSRRTSLQVVRARSWVLTSRASLPLRRVRPARRAWGSRPGSRSEGQPGERPSSTYSISVPANSRKVAAWPIAMKSSSVISCWLTRVPLTYVPLRLPRSVIE